MRIGSENQITLVLIRHGATQSNKEHRYLGRTEEALCVEGREILRNDRENNRYPEVDCLFSSPMKRCLETAGILYPNKEIVQISEWTEMDFGAFEGKNYYDLKEDSRYQVWIDSNGMLPFPEGESREEFVLRCEKGFLKMITLLSALWEMRKEEKKTAGAVVHGGTIMALLSRYYGGEYFDYQVSNGGGYRCVLENWKELPSIVHVEKIE